MSNDPMEALIREALEAAHLVYVEGDDPEGRGLDFFLPYLDVHIEVKQFHSPRIAEQMSRADNVIAVQGRRAVEMLASMLARIAPAS